jgi:hypothetical protein
LPLGNELFGEIISYAKLRGLYENILKADIATFLRYARYANGKHISEEEINFEEFISYLDIEHFLRLRGSDHWSNEGNRSQLVIRNLIALSLFLRQEDIKDEAFALYESFANRLEPGDWIFTFNYDTILEGVLQKLNIPYTFCKKTKLKMVDLKKSEEEILEYKGRYRFVDWNKADCAFDGFDAALELIFSDD